MPDLVANSTPDQSESNQYTLEYRSIVYTFFQLLALAGHLFVNDKFLGIFEVTCCAKCDLHTRCYNPKNQQGFYCTMCISKNGATISGNACMNCVLYGSSIEGKFICLNCETIECGCDMDCYECDPDCSQCVKSQGSGPICSRCARINSINNGTYKSTNKDYLMVKEGIEQCINSSRVVNSIESDYE